MELYFPAVLDGATGTELQKRGYTGGGCAEAWLLEHPDAILDVQRRYVAAGSNIIYTPTFGANRVKLEANGIFNRVEEFNLRLAALSKEAAAGRALVAGDIAPTGLFLAPLGTASFEELVEIYTSRSPRSRRRASTLFVIETMMTLPEARAALLAVKSVSAKPVLVSFTCDEHGRTLTGTDPAAALVVMQGMGADAFGLNCSVGPREILAQMERLRPWAEIPLAAKPNAGLPRTVDGRTVYDCPPEEFAEWRAQLRRERRRPLRRLLRHGRGPYRRAQGRARGRRDRAARAGFRQDDTPARARRTPFCSTRPPKCPSPSPATGSSPTISRTPRTRARRPSPCASRRSPTRRTSPTRSTRSRSRSSSRAPTPPRSRPR